MGLCVHYKHMHVGLLPGPGSYVGDYRKAERFPRPGTAILKPKTAAAVPRKVLDHNTMEFLDMPDRRQLFNGMV